MAHPFFCLPAKSISNTLISIHIVHIPAMSRGVLHMPRQYFGHNTEPVWQRPVSECCYIVPSSPLSHRQGSLCQQCVVEIFSGVRYNAQQRLTPVSAKIHKAVMTTKPTISRAVSVSITIILYLYPKKLIFNKKTMCSNKRARQR